MDYSVFMRRQLAQDRRMNTLMLEQIYCNLDGRAYEPLVLVNVRG